ncbi:hypothetical protein BGX26_006586, partial [Mortierella sp. AD094]
KIIGLWKANKTSAEFEAETGVPANAVRGIISTYKKRGTIVRPKSPEKPKTLSERDTKAIRRIIEQDRRTPLAEVTNQLPTK